VEDQNLSNSTCRKAWVDSQKEYKKDVLFYFFHILLEAICIVLTNRKNISAGKIQHYRR